MKTLGILGCGWLGMALAGRAMNANWQVIGTRQSEIGCEQLRLLGINGVVCPLPITKYSSIPYLGKNLVIALPLGKQSGLIESIVSVVEAHITEGCQRVVMISTTSVYGAATGHITEKNSVNPTTESGNRNLRLEQALLQRFPNKLKILRLSGLVGEDRHPVTVLSGRQLPYGGRPVNLIHQYDAVTAILALLTTSSSESIFHLSAFEHPSRGEYYCQQAKCRGLPLPIFTDECGVEEKIIDATWTCETLNIALKFPLAP